MAAEKNGAKILIADDDENARRVLEYILGENGFIVESAKSGKEALEKAAHNKPDLIILDVMMAGMDGFETYERLRKNADTQSIPVIFLSAQKRIKSVLYDLPGANVEYIEKPCDINYLIDRINALITKNPS